MMKPWKSIGFTVFLGIGGTIAALFWSVQSGSGPSAAYAQQAVIAKQSRADVLAHADSLSSAFRDVAKSLKPSVVSISAMVERTIPARANGRRNLPPGFSGDLFDLFRNDPFGDFGFQMPDDQIPRDQPQRPLERREMQAGLGSGVIVSPNGYILTNNHVVDGADKLVVQLSDKRKFDATVVGTDKMIDLAVLKIEASGLVPASIGNSDEMQVGDWVVAIGSPFGLSQTVTSGIVSAINRDDQDITDYDNFIQTDAAINPGNSGGPLLNLRGEVIGINTAIASRSGSFNGIGFAIPSNMVNSDLQNILKNGRVVRGYIGTALGELSPELASKLGLSKDSAGVVVSEVADGGPAAKAGLEPGDVIVSVNGEPMGSRSQLRRTVAFIAPGTPVKFDVNRKGKSVKLNLIIEEMSEEKLAALGGSRAAEQIGITVGPLTEQLATRMGISSREGGVVVTAVVEDSVAAGNIRPGEIILQVNDSIVRTSQEFAAALGKSKNGVKFLIRNEKGKRMLMLQ